MGEEKLMHTSEVEVRYQETDQMGVVYHANYLVWFEIGRTKLIEQLGFTYKELEEEGILLPVIDARLKYEQPARYGDKIRIETRIKEYKGVRLTFDYVIKNNKGDRLVTGYTTHSFVKAESFQPLRLRSVNKTWHRLIKSASEGK